MNIGLVKILRTLGDNSAEDISSKIQNGADSITANVTEPLLFSLVLKVVFIILLTYILARVIKFLFKIEQERYKEDITGRFIGNTLILIIYACGLTIAFNQIPQLNNVTNTLIAGSGIEALAISLAAQESLNNIVSGAFIALFKPFKVGDRITLVKNDITGTVEDITLRHTILKTYNNSRLVVPNATMNQEMLQNSNLIDSRVSAFLDVYVSYESDLNKAIEIMADVVGNHPYYIDVRTDEEMQVKPKVEVQVREFGEYSILMRANMWTTTVKENFEACSDARIKIKEQFIASGISFPYKNIQFMNNKMLKI